MFFILLLFFCTNMFSMESEAPAKEVSGIKSLKQLASQQVVKNLSNINKRNLRRKQINSINEDSIESLIDSVPEVLSINSKDKLWYLCRARSFAFKSDSNSYNINISSCGKFLSYCACTVRQNKAVFINLKNRKRVFEFDLSALNLRSRLSPCGRYTLFCHGNKFSIYDNENSMEIVNFNYKQEDISIIRAEFSPCERYVLIGYNRLQDNKICTFNLWDIETGNIKYTASVNASSNKMRVSKVRFSNDSKFLLMVVNNKFFISDTQKGEQVAALEVDADSIKEISFSFNNRYIVFILDFKVLIYDLQNLKDSVTLKEFDSTISLALFNPVNDQIVLEFEEKHEIMLLNLCGKISIINKVCSDYIKMSPSGKLLLTTKDKKAIFWDTKTGTKCFSLNFKKKISGVSFDSNDKVVFKLHNCFYIMPTPDWYMKAKVKDRDGLEEILHILRNRPEHKKLLDLDCKV